MRLTVSVEVHRAALASGNRHGACAPPASVIHHDGRRTVADDRGKGVGVGDVEVHEPDSPTSGPFGLRAFTVVDVASDYSRAANASAIARPVPTAAPVPSVALPLMSTRLSYPANPTTVRAQPGRLLPRHGISGRWPARIRGRARRTHGGMSVNISSACRQ
jgi:hypothetical protein